MQPIDQVPPQPLSTQAEAWRDAIVGFAQTLVRTPSPCGQESALAEILSQRLRELGYDEVFTDALGNVVARMRGQGVGPATLFVAPLDEADPGDRSLWQYDPYGGEIADGHLHGRGASDHKGALAAMAYGGALLKQMEAPRGDYLFAALVASQAHGSVGMRYLLDKTLPERGWHADLVVLGNPTNLDVYLGHRGRVEVEVVTIGRTSHAGAPWLGANAVYKMVPVIEAVQDLATQLPSHPFLEKSTLALTSIGCSPERQDAVPDQCAITLERRFLPAESPDEVVWQVQSIINRLAAADPEFKGDVRVVQAEMKTYTGLEQIAAKLMHPFVTEHHHGLVKTTVEALEGLGQSPRFGKWSFTTDGGYAATVKNLCTLGYAPGDEKYAQTPFDRVRVDQLVQAAAGYAAIARHIAG